MRVVSHGGTILAGNAEEFVDKPVLVSLYQGRNLPYSNKYLP
jgi:hypothetical protein